MSGARDWATVEFRIALSNVEDTDYVRVRIGVEHGIVVRFTVQYETVVDEQVFPVVRYDSAHGVAHRDRLDRRGQVVEKTWFPGRTFAEIATEAIATIKATRQQARNEFFQ